MDTVKKEDIANQLAKKNDLLKKNAIKYTNDVFDIIKESLINGDRVEIFGMFSFEIKEVEASSGIMNSKNKDGEIVKIPYKKPEHKKMNVKISKKLKSEIE